MYLLEKATKKYFHNEDIKCAVWNETLPFAFLHLKSPPSQNYNKWQFEGFITKGMPALNRSEKIGYGWEIWAKVQTIYVSIVSRLVLVIQLLEPTIFVDLIVQPKVFGILFDSFFRKFWWKFKKCFCKVKDFREF